MISDGSHPKKFPITISVLPTQIFLRKSREDMKKGRVSDGEKESILDDIEFEIELVEQVSVNIDYILNLIEKTVVRHGKAPVKLCPFVHYR